MRAAFRLVLLLGIGVASIWLFRGGGLDRIEHLIGMYYGTPHERYAARLRYSGLAQTVEGRQWLEAAEEALITRSAARLPWEGRFDVASAQSRAAAYVASLRRGQRYIVDIDGEGAATPAPFIDLFVREDDTVRHIAYAPAGATSLEFDVRSDGDYVVRIQPPLDGDVELAIDLRSEATLVLPVEGAASTRIQSFFGDPRDNGRRDHHGIDIFAPKGTPVLAAGDGIVSSVGTNRLGGNVVWVARPTVGEMHYYAHLDRQTVSAGAMVKQGEVIGTVGNTGNAAGTHPHLHFGIYAAGGPVDPLPYVAPARRRSTEESRRMRGSARKAG